MQFYELTYLISPELSEEEIKVLQEKINSLIQKEEGVLVEIKSPWRQKLAYPIKKEKEAYLSSLTFHLLSEKLKTLEKQLKTLPEILRFLLLTKPPIPTLFPIAKTLKIKRGAAKIGVGIKKEKKVELKEIEKKLEEILGE